MAVSHDTFYKAPILLLDEYRAGNQLERRCGLQGSTVTRVSVILDICAMEFFFLSSPPTAIDIGNASAYGRFNHV